MAPRGLARELGDQARLGARPRDLVERRLDAPELVAEPLQLLALGGAGLGLSPPDHDAPSIGRRLSCPVAAARRASRSRRACSARCLTVSSAAPISAAASASEQPSTATRMNAIRFFGDSSSSSASSRARSARAAT